MNLSATWSGWREPARTNFHGILMSVVVAVAAMSLAEHYHASAMLFAAVLPAHPQDNIKERATIFTVIGVSSLSTLAMVIYPMIVAALGLNTDQAGVFLGGTIHDVAQVIGAGYGMSKETGDVAT